VTTSIICVGSKTTVLPDGCHLNLLTHVAKKLLDPAKKHVTNLQLKSALNGEILLEKLVFLRCLK